MTCKLASRPAFLDFCFVSERDVTERECRASTRVPAKNIGGCAPNNCPSEFRICSACIVQGAFELVADRESGLCDFHYKNGADKKQPRERVKRNIRLISIAEAADLSEENERSVAVVRADRVAFGPPGCAPTLRPLSLVPPRPSSPLERGMLMLYDADQGGFVGKGVLEAVEIVIGLRKENVKTGVIAERLGTSTSYVSFLTTLDRLEPAVKRFFSLDRKPKDRLGISAGLQIANLRQDLQEKVAIAHLAGDLPIDNIKIMASRPINRYRPDCR